MSWVVIIGAAVAVWLALNFVLRMPRGGREITAAALLFGLAGYAVQGSPGLAGAPGQPIAESDDGQAALIELRKAMSADFGSGSNYIITADALVRQGQYGTAAGLLRGAIRQTPDDPQLWLALGNALVGHAQGMLTPAASLAYRRASLLAPGNPGPAFFTGLAQAQSGQFAEARETWMRLRARPAIAGSPLAPILDAQLRQLDALIAMQEGRGPGNGAASPAPPSAQGRQ
ncbi:tetratricopeptide repeat protein [uncultured Croceicoccus sp.]|uniref:tetratricopeptide repeat protein n=1 Tax=uncultured Croceicoccus sp. TaxID=1295329 RepID=UPI0026172ABE|nr:tetratricopeptide repeat protein [uncultured Croceicoccus sp.]